MPNVMAALPNIGDALCSKPQVWLTPTTRVPCSNAPKTRNPLKFAGCPKLANRSQPLVGRSSPYYEAMWRRYRCLTSFFPIVDTCLSCEDTAWQSCAMVPKWLFFCVLYFQRGACSTFHTCILNSHKGHTMCRSMADIQSTAAEIRRGKKRR